MPQQAGGVSPVQLERAVELPPHYYRDNFLRLCDTVEGQYADLLTSQESAFLESFRGVDFGAQCLYVRLVSRVGPWFRENKLDYPEIGELEPALDTLLDAELLLCTEGLDVDELGGLFTVGELRRAFPDLRGGTGGKAALLAAIEELELDEFALREALLPVDEGRIVAPLGFECVTLLQLLFFGNRHQSLTEFVLSDLGIARYYPYPLDREHRLFPHREALDEYLACAALGDLWYEAREAGDFEVLPELADEVLSREVRFPSSESRWFRLCNGLARELERQGDHERAFELYGRSRRHPARERQARLLEGACDWGGAVLLCEEILDAPWCEEEREAAGRILPRVKRKLDGSRVPRRRDSFEESVLSLTPGDVGVEQAAADFLAQQWQTVRYVENKLMNALFGLAFWREIFAGVPGAFHNPYQSVPSDMYDTGFRARREAAIAVRLEHLRGADLGEELLQAYREYVPFQCRWVDWRRIDAGLVEAAAQVIPREHLLAVWDRILFDPRENRRGFPDLIALGEKPGDYCLIEVKGPGDTLQDSQRRWLRYFQGQGIPAQVARVEWCDD